MKITREDLPPRQIILTIELDAEEMDPYMDRAYSSLAPRIDVPGFRRGKAPRSFGERFLRPEALLDEALEIAMVEATQEAAQTEELEVGGRPLVEVLERDPIILKATYPLTPLVTLDNYRDIRAELEPVEVTEERVQQALEELRQGHAHWEPVERAVQMGDLAVLDVQGVVDEREVTRGENLEYLAATENTNPLPGFAQALEGLQKGQDREFVLPIPADGEDADLAGKECTFHILLHEVKERQLPELDDEFAKGVSEGFESLDALRDTLQEELRAGLENEARRRLEEKTMDLLLERAEVELPPLLVEHEVEHLLGDEQEALRRQQVSMEEYLKNVGKNPQEHREELQPRAVERLRRAYALTKVAELENLDVPAEEVDQEVDSVVGSAREGRDNLRRFFRSPEAREGLAQGILNRKVVNRLVEIARGEEAPPEDSQERPKEE